jgi:EAL and modified HD-GYP domain-containing signal transduction protein
MAQPNADTRETLYVARQAILDARWQVFGYELLYRADGGAANVSMDLAAARVMTDAVLNVGLDTLTGGRPAFLNLTRSLLVTEAWSVLPPSAVVFELHQDIPVDEEVMAMCQQLHDAGYALALSDFTLDSDAEALLRYAKYVKVDVLAQRKTHAAIADYLQASGITLIAEHVENGPAFDAASAAGYTLFQGHFFCQPKTCTAAPMPASRVAYVQLLAALNRPRLSLSEIEELVKHDVSLSYRVLRCINSAAFGLRREIRSIHEALVLLGVEPIRSWASVWCVAGLNTSGTYELVTTALVRARCCELLGEHLVKADEGAELFLVGLCSLLDAMLGRPLEEAIGDLPLSATARSAVLGEGRNTARCVLDAVVAYENGLWDEAALAAHGAGLTPALLADAYARALRWSREFSRVAAAA